MRSRRQVASLGRALFYAQQLVPASFDSTVYLQSKLSAPERFGLWSGNEFL